MSGIEIGRLLRSDTTGFVVGCTFEQVYEPAFGAMVRAPFAEDYQIYGLIHDIRIDDDGLVRQMSLSEGLADEALLDVRGNRTVPVEIGVLALGYEEDGRIYHLLPPRPPLSLDVIYLCTPPEVARFTGAGRFGYFRHILRDRAKPVEELLAAHLRQAGTAQVDAGNADWTEGAAQELIALLRDDYPVLMNVLGAAGEIEITNKGQG